METIKQLFSDPNFNINLLTHGLILFSFLSVFFMTYIAKVSKNAFDKEIRHLVEEAVKEQLDNAMNLIPMPFDLSQLPLDKLLDEFSKENILAKAVNKSFFKLVTTVNVMLWVFLVVLVIAMNRYGAKIDVKEIAFENAIIFTFIGAVEYMFFTQIAFKFIPVEPSFISKVFMDKIKEKFN